MAQSGDMKAHNQTYGGFMRLLKIGTIVSAVLAAFVIWLIA
ncbi:aa3-type cytochrome c oxidase subunit IV [Sphingomonas sp. ST-64]|uniref:Aa3-type cytochrome c oxidase subunit IV n=1 Tax=Sphingomonas plantiphila TaxID=3163295 RepID=A0ABW8YJ99_9SPHN